MAPVEGIYVVGTPMLVLLCTFGGILTMIVFFLMCVKNKPKTKRMTKQSHVVDTKPATGYGNKPAPAQQTSQSTIRLNDDVPVISSASGRRHVIKAGDVGKLSFRVNDVLKMAIKDKKIYNKLILKNNRLEFEDVIGSGNFGLVYKGVLLDERLSHGKPVAVKTVQGPACTRENAEMFIKESARMAGFTHDNILSLIGITVKDEKPCIILPYMENGDLHSYITDTRRKLTLGNLTRFGYDVTKGMAYLASKKFIHRDLAARNCMVSCNGTVKVADFGLSRDLYESDYYRMTNSSTPLPLRWVALESIMTLKFTIKSDVWSFGVLFWELMTRGLTPYTDIKDNVEVIMFIKRGGRLTFPSYVPSQLSSFIEICWRKDPTERPDFSTISSVLRDMFPS